MYKFTNGLVFFDKKQADKKTKLGYKLLKKETNKGNKNKIKSINKSITENKKQIERIKLAYKEDSRNFVEQATQAFYDYVVLNCSVTGKYNKINNPEIRMQMEYDKTSSNIGRI